MPFTLVTRDEWEARPPLKKVEQLPSPIRRVVMVRTKTLPCDGLDECKYFMRRLQKFHMDKGLEDIPYSFIVTPDSMVYEGRGWNSVVPTPAERPELKGKSLVIGHVGDFPEESNTRRVMVRTTFDVIDYGIMNNRLIDWEFTFHELYSYIDNEGFSVKAIE